MVGDKDTVGGVITVMVSFCPVIVCEHAPEATLTNEYTCVELSAPVTMVSSPAGFSDTVMGEPPFSLYVAVPLPGPVKITLAVEPVHTCVLALILPVILPMLTVAVAFL